MFDTQHHYSLYKQKLRAPGEHSTPYVVTAALISVSSCLGIALSENEWFLANLNPYRSVVSATLDTILTVTSSSGGKVTLNSNNPDEN